MHEAWPGKVYSPRHCGGPLSADLPLYRACSRHQTEVVSLLVESDASRRTLLARATDGSLPLHSAVRYQAPEAVVVTLLGRDEGRCALLEPDGHSQLPLHAACRNEARPYVIDAVRPLLWGMFHGRMESRGLNLWKCDMQRMLRSMMAPERDFATCDMLDMLCKTMREFTEPVFALDLAVWRTSCAQVKEDPLSEQDALGCNRCVIYRSNVIVRGVIPVIENEPVEEAIRKMVDSGY